jgi:hypothetical protein
MNNRNIAYVNAKLDSDESSIIHLYDQELQVTYVFTVTGVTVKCISFTAANGVLVATSDGTISVLNVSNNQLHAILTVDSNSIAGALGQMVNGLNESQCYADALNEKKSIEFLKEFQNILVLLYAKANKTNRKGLSDDEKKELNSRKSEARKEFKNSLMLSRKSDQLLRNVYVVYSLIH